MSDDVKHGADDLDLEIHDASTDDRSMDDADRSDEDDESTEDESGTSLDLDPDEGKDDTKAKAKAAATEHAKAWAGKIATGKATLADIPANHQYLIPEVKAILRAAAGEEEKANKKDKPAKAAPAGKYSNGSMVRFELTKEKLQATDLEPDQVKILNAEFKDALSHGYDPDVALKRAIREAGVTLGATAEDMPTIKQGSKPTNAPKTKFDGTEDPNKMSRKELAEFTAAQPHRR